MCGFPTEGELEVEFCFSSSSSFSSLGALRALFSLDPILIQREGRDKFCRNYDFQYKMPGRPGFVDFTVTAVRGHLTGSDFPDAYRKWADCDPADLFEAPVVTAVSKVSGCMLWECEVEHDVAPDACYIVFSLSLSFRDG